MLAILAFFLVVLAAGLGFAWLADHPGTVSLIWQGQEVGTSFTVFVVLQIALVVAAILLFWLVRGFFKAPDRVSRFFSTRRRDRGYRALSAGMIAAGAGDAVTAGWFAAADGGEKWDRICVGQSNERHRGFK